MSRPLHLLLAAAMLTTVPALSVTPAAAQQAGIQFVHDDWTPNWKNDRRYWHKSRRHWRHERPGFSFSFGVPFPPRYSYYRPRPRDCFRDWDGSFVCRTY